jgi:hypothetical protein
MAERIGRARLTQQRIKREARRLAEVLGASCDAVTLPALSRAKVACVWLRASFLRGKAEHC